MTRYLAAALGVGLVLVGGIGTYDVFLSRTDRIGPDVGLWGTGILTSGLLLLWATRLRARRPTHEELQTLGKRVGVGGLLLALVPVGIGMAIDTWRVTEGYATLMAMLLLGEPGACLVIFSILILIAGGAFS